MTTTPKALEDRMAAESLLASRGFQSRPLTPRDTELLAMWSKEWTLMQQSGLPMLSGFLIKPSPDPAPDPC